MAHRCILYALPALPVVQVDVEGNPVPPVPEPLEAFMPPMPVPVEPDIPPMPVPVEPDMPPMPVALDPPSPPPLAALACVVSGWGLFFVSVFPQPMTLIAIITKSAVKLNELRNVMATSEAANARRTRSEWKRTRTSRAPGNRVSLSDVPHDAHVGRLAARSRACRLAHVGDESRIARRRRSVWRVAAE